MIRQFRPEDAQTCSELIRASIAIEPGMSEQVRQKLLSTETPAAMLKRAQMYYVAVYESESKVVGVGALEMNEIRLLYVDPGHQRKGIGSSLLAHLESMVPATLFADFFVYSSLDAVGFYERHGFRSRGHHPFYIEGKQLMTVFMTKRTVTV